MTRSGSGHRIPCSSTNDIPEAVSDAGTEFFDVGGHVSATWIVDYRRTLILPLISPFMLLRRLWKMQFTHASVHRIWNRLVEFRMVEANIHTMDGECVQRRVG
jgi:hypothetical protein